MLTKEHSITMPSTRERKRCRVFMGDPPLHIVLIGSLPVITKINQFPRKYVQNVKAKFLNF